MLQDALKAQSSLLPWRKAVECLCITSYKMMVRVSLSYNPRRWSSQEYYLLSLPSSPSPSPNLQWAREDYGQSTLTIAGACLQLCDALRITPTIATCLHLSHQG